MMQPITEASNPYSQNIDVATPEEIVSILHKCDKEIFEGWTGHDGLYSESILSTLGRISEVAAGIIQDPTTSVIVLSGCGTSGRLGFMTARTFNRKLKSVGREPCFRYLIAGGDKALFTSQEAPEDDPICGIEMLKEVCTGKTKVLYIGITCGLSAPYVAGQLDYCLQNLEVFTPVLLGFNPTNLARNVKIEKWNKTFLDVVRELENAMSSGKVFILNPVVGADPITGSSRMKSGSATKILLETIFVGAYLSSSSLPQMSKPWTPNYHLDVYRRLCEKVYSQPTSKNIAKLISIAGECLQKHGCIYYLGLDSLGLVGMVDASECPPTYSATLDDVRGFLTGGYEVFENAEGDLSHFGKHFRISVEDMKQDIVPNIKSHDLVICLSLDGNLESGSFVGNLSCHKALITFDGAETTLKNFDVVISTDLGAEELGLREGGLVLEEFRPLFYEIFTKWVCNAVTTGAHVLKGKVYQNIMVDLKVSNNKLYYRSVGIVQKFSGLSQTEAEAYLQRSIYRTDNLTDSQRNSKVADHIEEATSLERVVPRALLAAILKCPIAEADDRLRREPVIRTVISKTLSDAK